MFLFLYENKKTEFLRMKVDTLHPRIIYLTAVVRREVITMRDDGETIGRVRNVRVTRIIKSINHHPQF